MLCSVCAVLAGADGPAEKWRPAESDKLHCKDARALSSYESTGDLATDGKETLVLDITLGNIMYVLWWASGCPEPSLTVSYQDVSPDDPFYKAVMWAYETGVRNTNDHKYQPDLLLRRGQVVTYVYRWAGSPGIDGIPNPYSDVPSNQYFYNGIVWSSNDPRFDAGPIEDGKFKPYDYVEEIIAVKTDDGVTFTLSNHEWETVIGPTYSCTEDGMMRSRCASCGLVFEEYFWPTHDLEYHEGKEPTCTEPGWGPYESCKNCDYSTLVEIPPAGHRFAYYEAEPAGCIDVGWDKYGVCVVCGYSTYKEIPATGHDLVQHGSQEPTCTGAGWDEYEVCTKCGWSTRKTFSPLGHYFGADRSESSCLRCGAKKPGDFSDVPSGEYYADAVTWAIDREITSGTGAGKFSPKEACTRCQVVTFLWRAAGSPDPEKNDNPFTDVKSTEYYYKAVLWAVENGITLGTSATKFSPNKSCTRGEIVTFIWRSKGKPDPVGNAFIPFVDIKVFDYFFTPTIWATMNGVTNGTDPTHFSPNVTCTRAQIVTFLYRSAGK